MHLLKLLREFVKVGLCISRHLPNKKKLKFDQAFNACWSFCFELNTKGVEWVKVLNVLGQLCLWQCFFTLPVNRLTNIVSEHQPTTSGNLMIGHGYNRDLTNKCTLKCLLHRVSLGQSPRWSTPSTPWRTRSPNRGRSLKHSGKPSTSVKLAVETKLKHFEEAVEISSNPLFRKKKYMIALTPKHKMKQCIN